MIQPFVFRVKKELTLKHLWLFLKIHASLVLLVLLTMSQEPTLITPVFLVLQEGISLNMVLQATVNAQFVHSDFSQLIQPVPTVPGVHPDTQRLELEERVLEIASDVLEEHSLFLLKERRTLSRYAPPALRVLSHHH